MLRFWQVWGHTCGSNITCCHELVVTESLHWNLPQLEALQVTQDIMEAIHRCYERTGEIRFSPRHLKFLGDWQRNIFRINPSTILDILASTCLQMVSFKTFELTSFWCVWSHEKWQSRNDLSCEKLGCVFGYNPVSESGRMTAKAWRSTTLRWRHRVLCMLCILCVSDISVYCWKVGVRHDSPGNVGSFATAPAWNTTRSAIPETWMLQMSYSSRIPGMFCHRFGSGIPSLIPEDCCMPTTTGMDPVRRIDNFPIKMVKPANGQRTISWIGENAHWVTCEDTLSPGISLSEGWACLFEIPRMYDSMTKAIWLWLVFLPADSCELFFPFQTTNEAPVWIQDISGSAMLATFDKFHQLLVYRRMLEMSLAFWPCCWNAWCYCWWLLAVRETWSWSSNLAKSKITRPLRIEVSLRDKLLHVKLFFFSWISKDNLRKLSSGTWKPKLTSIVGHASKLRKLVEGKVTRSQPKEAGENGWNMADSVVFQSQLEPRMMRTLNPQLFSIILGFVLTCLHSFR